jgi:hypothetical protein
MIEINRSYSENSSWILQDFNGENVKSGMDIPSRSEQTTSFQLFDKQTSRPRL